MKKYELTGIRMIFEGRTLRRIRYLENIKPYITKNMIGGWIESEHNLSHEGSCAVRGEAKVFGNAKVMENANVNGLPVIKDNAIVGGSSRIYNKAIIGADTIVGGSAMIIDTSKVFFYQTAMSSNEPNIQKEVLIEGNTVIEATGFIDSGNFNNGYLLGHLNGK